MSRLELRVWVLHRPGVPFRATESINHFVGNMLSTKVCLEALESTIYHRAPREYARLSILMFAGCLRDFSPSPDALQFARLGFQHAQANAECGQAHKKTTAVV